MTRTTAQRRTFGAVAAVVALLVLSACGGAASAGDVASAGGETNPAEEDAEQEQVDEQAQALAFAQCMRDNGFDMDDPGPGQEGLMSALQVAHGEHDQTTVDEVFEAAFATCEDLLPEFATQDHAQPDEEAMLALAECLRDEGLDVPDDLYSGGGMHDIDRNELEAALEACRDVVDFGGHR
jgi:hypothetical protein